jgi:hypothetical protein
MHEKWAISAFLLKIAEKEGKTDFHPPGHRHHVLPLSVFLAAKACG